MASELESRIPPELAARVLTHALRRGGEFAELFAEHRDSDGISADDGRIERVTSGLQRGAGIRVVSGGVWSLAFTETLEPETLLKAADRASEVARYAAKPVSGVAADELTGLASHRGTSQASLHVSVADLRRPERAALVERGERAARSADQRIRQVTVFLGTIVQQVLVANSDGRYVGDVRHRLRYRIQVVARAKGPDRVGVGTYAPGVSEGFDFLRRQPPEQIARRAVEQALAQLEAGPAPTGPMPVILGNAAGGVLVHEACGHALEADTILRGSSVFAGQLGQSVGSPLVTVVDDGRLPAGWGSSVIDDEGEPTGRTVLVEAGVLASYLNDRVSAASLPASPTGNGRRASFRHLPVPRMRNTFIAAGQSSRDDVIAATPHGLYAPSLSGGQVDPTSGDFLFTAREAYLVRDGRIDRPVLGATIAGNALEVLRGIDMVGDDLEVAAGNCAREGQRVFVGLGQPTVRLARMVVGGTDRGAARARRGALTLEPG